MGGKKNKNIKKQKTTKKGTESSQAAGNSSFISNSSPAAQDDNTVTPQLSSVAKEGGTESVSVSIIQLKILILRS